MISKKDLRIGNHVYHAFEPVEITALMVYGVELSTGEVVSYNEIFPIELNELHVAQYCGYVPAERRKDPLYDIYERKNDTFTPYLFQFVKECPEEERIVGDWFLGSHDKPFKYVHELENLLYANYNVE